MPTDTSPQTLLDEAKCYACYGTSGFWALMELVLLQKILEAIESGGGAGNIHGNGSPVGAVTPTAIGEIYLRDDIAELWRSTGLTNTDWLQLI